jgi:predicted ABC-type ATPase
MPAVRRRGTARHKRPSLIVLAGPNGAGKSTAAPALLRGTLRVTEFVNADVIARGLSAFDPEGVALSAGRIMLRRLDELASRRETFAFETTLASRHFAPWIEKHKAEGYRLHLIFLWLPSADAAVLRVATRVSIGGHGVPEETVRRRYNRGLVNLFELFMPLATTWLVYDSSQPGDPRLIAHGRGRQGAAIRDHETWRAVRKAAKDVRP